VRALGRHTFPNLFVNAHGQPQVGDAHGFSAAIAEMLLQSHEDVVALLPALPASWPTGAVTRLRARGGFVVSLWWAEGALTRAAIEVSRTGPCVVRTATPVVVRSAGAAVPVQAHPAGPSGKPAVITRFDAENGRTYELHAAAAKPVAGAPTGAEGR